MTRDRLLTLEQVADELACSVSTVKRRVRAGELPVFADGRRLVRVRDTDLRRYVLERVARRARGRAAEPTGRPLPADARLWD